MNRATILTVIIACIVIAGTQTGWRIFTNKLKAHAAPIPELEWKDAERGDSLVYTVVRSKCGEPTVGRLGMFLACKDRVIAVYVLLL